jgi:putative ABC transport system ATP-binding protein
VLPPLERFGYNVRKLWTSAGKVGFGGQAIRFGKRRLSQCSYDSIESKPKDTEIFPLVFLLTSSPHPNIYMPIIETRDLRKQFGVGDVAVEVLRGVNLSIEAGEFVALMGPSGSGKSTLMSIVGGIEPPTSGDVMLEGVNISHLTDDQRTLLRRRRIGFIFQAFNLIPTLSALENVSLPLELDGVPSRIARERAAGALERVELSHRANHIPSKLSGGEQQRVAVARAIVIEPAILLADEPTGNLDSRQSERVTALLRSLAADHKHTIVMVTHDAKVARSAFRLLMFRDGMIERDVNQSDFEHGFPAGDSGTFMRPNYEQPSHEKTGGEKTGGEFASEGTR